jgi:choline-sulfatase
VAAHVSLVDLLPTFMDIAGVGTPFDPVDAFDGSSLLPLATGEAQGMERVVISEYSSEGVCAPSRMIRLGSCKYILTHGLPPLLFDLQADPDELRNLAGDPALARVQSQLHERLIQDWDPAQVHQRVLSSQRRRLFLDAVHGSSRLYSNWAYQPFTDDTQRFIRGSGAAGPTSVKARARFPYVEPVLPDRPAPPDTDTG